MARRQKLSLRVGQPDDEDDHDDDGGDGGGDDSGGDGSVKGLEDKNK